MKGLSLIHPVDPAQLDKETLRIYEICDGCRRCFNLCPSFNTLLNGIDRLRGRRGEADAGGSSPDRRRMLLLQALFQSLPLYAASSVRDRLSPFDDSLEKASGR